MLNWNAATQSLGVAEMDATHEAFVRLLDEAIRAGDDDFPYLFAALAEHTRAHFDNESRLMRACRFPATYEHEAEHRRALGDLLHMQNAIAEGRLRFARLYVSMGLPDWFRNHLATMDAALAACLKRSSHLPEAMPSAIPSPAPGRTRAPPDRAL